MSVKVILLSVLFILGALSCPDNTNLFISSPKTLAGLSGSCLHIPCSFRARKEEEFDNKRKVVGVWMKTDARFAIYPGNVIFNSSKSDNTYPMKITGNLPQKNCTSLFSDLNQDHKKTLFFRIENEKFRATAACNDIQITVTDSAWSPSISISGDVKDLKEKESVSISCSAWTPCPLSPPELTWSLQQDSQRQTETNPDGTFTSKIQETMTLSDTHDGSNITCSVRYPVDGGKRNKTAETNLTLSVSYTPKDTSASISPSGLVSAGSWVELSCSSRAKPPVRTFTWFRNTTGGPVNVSVEQVYGFNVTDGGEFYCVAVNNLGNQTSPVIHLNVEVKSLSWTQIIGGFIGIILPIVFILTVMFLRREKMKNTFRGLSVHRLQTQIGTDKRYQTSTKETVEEEIHYGELNFSNLRINPPSSSTPEQETVYARVKVSANPSTSDLYAQVGRKMNS